MELGKTCRVGLGAVATAVLLACGGSGGSGGSGAGAVVASPPVARLSGSGPTILRDGEIAIRFSESMNPASLELAGALVGEAAGTWSTTVAGNDTYTLRPADGAWSLGVWLDLAIVNAKDSAGEALAAPVTAKFFVPLDFGNAQNASVVIGQADFAAGAENQGATVPSGNTLSGPYGAVAVAPDGKLFVPDYWNNRILAFNSAPAANNASADYVLGAVDLVSRGRSSPARSSVGRPNYVSVAGNRMAVADYTNHRVLIYDAVPGRTGEVPSVVVGQASFDTGGSGCGASRLHSPEAGVLTPGGRLIVTDSFNHRVLVWNTVPTVNGQPPDLVLGQAGFSRCIELDDDQDGVAEAAPTARTMFHPSGVWSDDARLVVNDTFNSRVLIWNTFPSGNFAPADVVLGQADFARATPNDDDQDGFDEGPTARTLKGPYLGVASNGAQLAVADTNNFRVLIWNTFPSANFQPADVVLGQPDFTSADELEPSPSWLQTPTGLHFSGDKLYVTDPASSRVLVFTSR